MITRRIFSFLPFFGAAAGVASQKEILPARIHVKDVRGSPTLTGFEPLRIPLGEMEGSIKVHALVPGTLNIIEADPVNFDVDRLLAQIRVTTNLTDHDN